MKQRTHLRWWDDRDTWAFKKGALRLFVQRIIAEANNLELEKGYTHNEVKDESILKFVGRCHLLENVQ